MCYELLLANPNNNNNNNNKYDTPNQEQHFAPATKSIPFNRMEE